MQDWVPTELFVQETKVYLTLQGIEEITKSLGQGRIYVFQKLRTNEILVKPTGEQIQRLTRGLSPVYERDEKRYLFLAAEQ